MEYEHKYRIKLPLARTVSQDCIDQIFSRFNISDIQFHDSSLTQLLVFLSTMCTPSTRQEMTTFLTKYSCSLCTVASPHGIQHQLLRTFAANYVQKMMRLLEFISFDPKSIKAMPLENFMKDSPGLWLIIQNIIPFSWLKNFLDYQHHPDRKNIKSTSAIFAYINLQCKLLKKQEIHAKETENMFIGSSADQLLPVIQLVQPCMPFKIIPILLLNQPR